jgi:predicted RNA-binding Zn-ribbon protein involved in translation (DUF1610 family)
MRNPRFLRRILALLVAEHTCFPPDDKTGWHVAPQSVAVRPGLDIYICPECGQHMVRDQAIRTAA